MLVWLDGRLNTRQRPQENFGSRDHGAVHVRRRQLHRAGRLRGGARVHRLESAQLVNGRPTIRTPTTSSSTTPATTTPTAKTFTFPIYSDGSHDDSRAGGGRRHAGRHRLHHRAGAAPGNGAAAGAQDVELLRQRARAAGPGVRRQRRVASICGTAPSIRPVVHYMLRSRLVQNPGNWHTRYSWPVEFVVRAIKEIGWAGFSVDAARMPLTNGPDAVRAARRHGLGARQGWFSTGAMLSRMNFAATLAFNQRFNLARATRAERSHARERCSTYSCRAAVAGALRSAAVQRAADVSDRPAGRGPAPTRSCSRRRPGLRRLIVGLVRVSVQSRRRLDGSLSSRIHSRRRLGVHRRLRRARVSERHGARAGRAQPQPRRRLSRRRQRRVEHGRAVSGSVLLQPAAAHRGSAGQVLQIGSDASGKTLGLHPRLTGLRSIFN